MQIGDLKVRLESKVHGSFESIQDIEGLISEAARNVLLMIDPVTTKRKSQIENAIYDQVYSYTLPADLKGDKIIDVRPQANRQPSDVINATYQKEFDVWKESDTMAVEMDSGVKTIKLNKPLTPSIVLNDSNSLTDNGTWAVTDDATNLTLDTVNKVSGSASLKFDAINGGGAAIITNSTMTAQDLSSIKNEGAIFTWVYLSAVEPIAFITLRWGSSATDYWTKTVTAAHDSTELKIGWNLLRFDWNGATEMGTPDETAVNFLSMIIAYDGTAMTAIRLDSVIAKIGTIYEIIYYSKYLFKSNTGTWKETPTDDEDTINLDVEEQNLLLYEMCYLVGQEFGGEDSSFDTNYWEKKRNEAWEKYMRTYKSEKRKPSVRYYRM